jgi:hypothetical protein
MYIAVRTGVTIEAVVEISPLLQNGNFCIMSSETIIEYVSKWLLENKKDGDVAFQ